MQEMIGEYKLTKQLVYTPIHKIYQAERIEDSGRYVLDIVYAKCVPKCYLFTNPKKKTFKDPFLLLTEVFPHPEDEELYVFVETRPQGLRKLASLVKQNSAPLDRRLLWMLRIARLLPIVLNNGTMHDFEISKVLCDKKDNIILQKFIKNKRQAPTHAQLQENINKIISELFNQNEIGLLKGLRFYIQNADCCHLLTADQKVAQTGQSKVRTEVDFCFTRKGQSVEYKCLYIQMEENSIIQNWRRKVNYQELEMWPSRWLALSSHQLEVDSFEDFEQHKIMQMTVPARIKQIIQGEGPPYNSIGIIESKMTNKHGEQQIFYGTGVLVSKNLVISCAHNLKIAKDRQIFEAIKEQVTFCIGQAKYVVSDFRFSAGYNLNNYQSKQDYALLKLKDEIHDIPYIPIVKNYRKKGAPIKIKGPRFFQNRTIIKTDVVQASKFEYTQAEIDFQCLNSGPQKGFSGTPIMIFGAERYYFMVGIFCGQSNKGYRGNMFEDKNISDFRKWEEEMTKEVKIFKNVYSYETVLNMDQELKYFKQLLDEISFNQDQITYFSKLFKKIDYEKAVTQRKVQAMFRDAIDLDSEEFKGKGLKKLELILSNMGSFSYQQRHNNVAFMCSLRNYEDWTRQFTTFGERLSVLLVTIYIIKRIHFFFDRAIPPTNQPKEAVQFQQFQKEFNTKIYAIYNRQMKNSQKIAKMAFQLLKKIGRIIDITPLNANFKRFIKIQRDYATSIFLKFNDERSLKVFYVPKLLMYTFIAKQGFLKMAQLDRDLFNYFIVLDSFISIFLRIIKEKDEKGFQNIAHNFLWGVKEVANDRSVKEIIDAINQERSEAGKALDAACQVHYFSKWSWTFLTYNYDLRWK